MVMSFLVRMMGSSIVVMSWIVFFEFESGLIRVVLMRMRSGMWIR